MEDTKETKFFKPSGINTHVNSPRLQQQAWVLHRSGPDGVPSLSSKLNTNPHPKPRICLQLITAYKLKVSLLQRRLMIYWVTQYIPLRQGPMLRSRWAQNELKLFLVCVFVGFLYMLILVSLVYKCSLSFFFSSFSSVVFVCLFV